MKNVLVSYFSASGVTKGVAYKIGKVLDGDIFEIEPVDRYTSDDLNWNNENSRSSIEMKDKSFRPPVKNKVKDMDKYDTVVIGFPIWWYTAPTIINTFIEENNMSGKDIYIFVTSGGSSVDGSFNDLKNAYSDLKFVKGVRFNSNVSDDEIRKALL